MGVLLTMAPAGARAAGKKLPKTGGRLALVAPRPKTASRMSLGHIGVDRYTEKALVESVVDHALHGTETRQVVTVNAQFYVLADKSPRFRECLNAAEYSCADGAPIVWACGKFAKARVQRIPGVELIEGLCQRGAAHGLRIFFLGGSPTTARTTAQILSRRYPGIVVAGVSCPDWGFEKDEAQTAAVLAEIDAAKPHVVLVGLGAPKQEFFINDKIRPMKIPIAIGIGGSFEILSGSLERAPKWVQARGLEWAFRLRQEPRRLWRRYLIGNAEFAWSLLKWRFRTLGSTAVETTA